MWTRIYVGVLASAVLVVGFFSWYAASWLGSIGRPADAIAGYQYHSDVSWYMLVSCSVVLAALATAVLWVTGRAWGLWTTLAFFAIFAAIHGFWLNRSYADLLERSTGMSARLWGTPVVTAFAILGAAAAALSLQFAVVRINQKFYPPDQLEQANGDMAQNEEDSRLI